MPGRMGSFIKRRLGELGLSQKALADSVNVSPALVTGWVKSGALPAPEYLERLARALMVDENELQTLRQQEEEQAAAKPRSDQSILLDAAAYLQDHPDTDIWMLGPENLPVLQSGIVRDAWLENLAQGFSYHLIWLLDDWLDETSFAIALPHFAQIAKEASANGGGTPGKIHFYGIAAEDGPQSADKIRLYELFRSGVGKVPELKGRLEVLKSTCLSHLSAQEAERIRTATARLVRIWQPETSLILYLPRGVSDPPVANISLMDLSETRGGEPERPMYWLDSRGAARLSAAIIELREAIKSLNISQDFTKGEDT